MQNDAEIPTESDLAEMDKSIENLKSQISSAKEELKQLNSGISFSFYVSISCSAQRPFNLPSNRRNSNPHR